MLNLDDELVLEYLAEARKHLAAAEKDILAIEAEQEDLDEERVNRICLWLHSVKGGSVLFDLDRIGVLAQKTENAIARIGFQGIAPSKLRITVLLRAIHQLNEMIRKPATSDDVDIGELVDQLAMPDSSLEACIGSGSASAASPAFGRQERLRILIVEDDLVCRLLLQTFLSRYGECDVARSGREAIEAFRTASDGNSPYGLICMDIMMPEMDGRQAVREIRALEESRGIQSPHGATIFMTTTVHDIRDVFRCFGELCDAYLLKPIDLGQLLSKMQFFKLVP